MKSDIWSIALIVAALALFTAGVSAFLRARAKDARRSDTLKERIERARTQLDEARARLAAGEITTERSEEIERHIGAKLLEGDTWTATLRALRQSARIRLGLTFTGALILAGLAIGVAQWGGKRGPASASPASAGTNDAKTPDQTATAPPQLTEKQLQRMIDQAAVKVSQDPKDAASWAMLAHSYDMLGKFAESSKAYAKLAELMPKDAQVLADYADALGVANGRSLKGEPTALVRKAIALDGKNLKALALSGTAAFERDEFAEAIGFWQRAVAVSTDAVLTRQIQGSIADAKAAVKGEPPAARAVAATKPAASGAATKGTSISGRVTLADDLVAKTKPDATVFIFARPVQGSSRMPVAILRKHVRDLPADFTLDDSMAMVPDAKLSREAAVVIGARVSQRGDVMPEPGDMQGWSAPVNVGTSGLRLEISEVIK